MRGLIFFLLLASAYAKTPDLVSDSFLSDIKRQVDSSLWKREYALYSKDRTFLKSLQGARDLVFLKEINRYRYLDSILKRFKNTGSVLYAALLIQETTSMADIYNKDVLEKYIHPAATFLKEHNLCFGYLYSGIYDTVVEKDASEALKDYDDGIRKCKIGWKRMAIISHKNRLLHDKR